MKNIVILLLFTMSYLAFSAQGGKKVAKVKLSKGTASFTAPDGSTGNLKRGDWVTEGTIIKTANKSFVRLSFIDKSSMNIGPKSELKIEKFSKKDAGVINVLTGKIRSKVTKDYLQMDKGKSKLFVKSKTAVMGVRGTDFMFSTNAKTGNTTTVLFEGAIVFNKLPRGGAADLEKVVSAGRRVKPGQVSIAMKNKPKPTVPAKMNSKQFSKLQNNVNLAESNQKKAKKMKSPVPPGLTGDVVASDPTALKEEIKKVVKMDLVEAPKQEIVGDGSKGFKNGQDEKPADGVMVHLDTGAVIQPASDATFDANTGEWVSTSMGDINAAGEYIPPADVDITSDGAFVTQTDDGKVAVIPGMGEAIVPVDQNLNFDDAPKVELPPEIAIQVQNDIQSQNTEGPAPAGSVAPAPESFDQGFTAGNDGGNFEVAPIIPVEINNVETFEQQVVNANGPQNFVGGGGDQGGLCENCAPLPTGVSTLDPNSGSGVERPGGDKNPPSVINPAGTTRVRVNID